MSAGSGSDTSTKPTPAPSVTPVPVPAAGTAARAVGKNAFAKTASNMKVYIPKKNYKAYKNKLVGAGIGKNVTYKKILVLDM